MRKLLIIIAVFSFVSGVQGKVWFPLESNPASNNIYPATSPVITICIQNDNGQVYVINLELTDNEEQGIAPIPDSHTLQGKNASVKLYEGNRTAAMNTTSVQLFPEPMTIIMLGLAGLLLHRRRNA